ncbi:hypothetical protein I308_105898 [Cryptococcus tetragattii IND107]|uniref:RING-type E3 ubiquitin transferase n=1 Tax=Cryptococcus tetragattii IND107 TaxID=1296105 RepID=A0ABR3BKG1_9TREE|nr:peroxin-10 [Cryptococcus tetragattii IND107]
MDAPVASSSSHYPQPLPPSPYADLSFEPASQAQILRSHQRDTAQIHRLTELASEIARSLAGTRWLAQKQILVDLLVKAVYLSLTLGRGSQTLGEEYTDILPYSPRRRSSPSKTRRFLTIMFLLFPTVLVSPASTSYIRTGGHSQPSSRWRIAVEKIGEFLSSPLGKAIPELHMIVFLFRGRFFELGRRLTGMSYISALPPTPPEQRPESYEPLGLLLLIPFIHRLSGPWLSARAELPQPSSHETWIGDTIHSGKVAESAPIIDADTSYDSPKTYLTQEALDLPERQCTLCLEPRGTGEGSGGTVAVTECGHVFCWGCLGGLEKLECPLCRQSLRMERLIAAYNL